MSETRQDTLRETKGTGRTVCAVCGGGVFWHPVDGFYCENADDNGRHKAAPADAPATGTWCDHDTNGDGDCGRPMCPTCNPGDPKKKRHPAVPPSPVAETVTEEQAPTSCTCWIGRGDSFGMSDEREKCGVHGQPWAKKWERPGGDRAAHSVDPLQEAERLLKDIDAKIQTPIGPSQMTWHGEESTCEWCGVTWSEPKIRDNRESLDDPPPPDYKREHPVNDCVWLRFRAFLSKREGRSAKIGGAD